MSLKEKAVVLLSGGLDSTVSLAEAVLKYEVVQALTFNYGQRAFGKELKASRRIAEHYHVPHKLIALPWLSELLPDAMRIRRDGRDPDIHQEWDPNSAESAQFFDAKPVWVPNRNGLFLNIAAVYAESMEAQVILFGANAEEGERFPDNTDAFRSIVSACFELSTLNRPRIECPVGLLNKPDIIERAVVLDVPLNLIWSCYGDGDTQCGVCPSCFRLKRAIGLSTNATTLQRQVAFSY